MNPARSNSGHISVNLPMSTQGTIFLSIVRVELNNMDLNYNGKIK